MGLRSWLSVMDGGSWLWALVMGHRLRVRVMGLRSWLSLMEGYGLTVMVKRDGRRVMVMGSAID